MTEHSRPDSPRMGQRLPTGRLLLLALVGALAYTVASHPPIATVAHDELGLRRNWLTGNSQVVDEGRVLLLPGLQTLQRFPRNERRSTLSSDEHGEQAPKSSEGMPVSARIEILWRIDPARLAEKSRTWPDDLEQRLVTPLMRRIVERDFGSRTVLELVGPQPALHAALLADLRAGFAAEGLQLQELRLPDLPTPDALAEHIYRPSDSVSANGAAPLQTAEGLSIGAALDIRYALDPGQLKSWATRPIRDLDGELVAALVRGVIYKQFAQYTVREILSDKRQQLREGIEHELAPLMAADGLVLRSVSMGTIDLPADYREGMDRLLAAELQTRQMEYTLALKEKQVRETELAAEADKVRRDKAAEAAANEQVIAAKAQEEAMKHVLPFKQKQLEQRRLESEADKEARIAQAQASAEARRIEAAAEADSRRALTDADAYRIDKLGQIASQQLERDGAVIARYPLMIQKTMADKLSDKVSVIIAPPPGDGGFVGSTLLGMGDAAERH